MNGHVDGYGRALLTVTLRPAKAEQVSEVEVWVDTGFNGDLVLPRRTIEELGLPASGSVKAVLADGSQVKLRTYSCIIDWFGEQRELEIVSNDGEYPLLGVGLLLGHDLHVSYQTERLPSTESRRPHVIRMTWARS